ncbi:neurogenic protein big brain [Cylas formicarius]|uniref:neurogenic protein big brain n=1 Tax=Cylas formicarius TaxID=197179 RepID=UPI002958C8B7|nr:neurogenic protein big brain [Cylas formicarius]
MPDENRIMPRDDDSVEFYLAALFEKFESVRKETVEGGAGAAKKVPFRTEIITFNFWKSVISECLASFIYVFLVCGAAAGSASNNALLATSLASGFAMTFLTHIFGHVSGAHVNPAVSVAMGVIKRISILRTGMFILAQCGGGIGGAAFIYGITAPRFQENILPSVELFDSLPRFGLEFILTFTVVFSYFMSMDTYRKWMGSSSIIIGITYSACTFIFIPFLNPVRSLGPSFVLNKWNKHWIDWLGPMLGGMTSGLIYEYIFNPNRIRKQKKARDEESSHVPSDDDLNYDDLDKPQQPKFHGSTYNTYRSASGIDTGRPNYCPSLCSAPPARLERVESLYGGTKSLYCKSPPLTRANLNRSQSVYTKSNSAVNRDLLPQSGPLVPTQSMYPMRLNQQNHLQNQNLQNQLQQRTEQTYGIRGITPGTSSRSDNYGTSEKQLRSDNYSTTERQRRDKYSTESAYGTRTNPSSSDSSDNNPPPSKPNRNRPESMYGILGSQPRTYQPKQVATYSGPPEGRNVIGGPSQTRPPQNNQILSPPSNSGSYHHHHSPNPQH